MPELPEVENLRRGLERAIVGQKILRVKVLKPKLVSGKGAIRAASRTKALEFVRGLTGERFESVERRAKNLIFRLKSGPPSRKAMDGQGKVILVHLKMSGQFVYKSKTGGKKIIGGHPIELSEKQIPNKHTHVIFHLQKGTLYYNDTRMFGYLLYYPTKAAFEAGNHFGLFGLEPLSRGFTPKYLKAALTGKKGMIKAILMDQKVVVGIGNIYADESLFEARIRPERSAGSLSGPEVTRLHAAIIRITRRAIKLGGSSVATYRMLDESRGNYAREHKVYGKGNGNCSHCKKPLKKISIQTRTTVFCPSCQK